MSTAESTPFDVNAEVAYWADLLKRQPFPEHVREGLSLFLGAGIKPGSYLTAVLESNLLEAVRRADLHSEAATFAIVRWLVSMAPAVAWGNRTQVNFWIETIRTRRQAVTS